MSSLRNAVQRRNHKERAQPLERSKWGLLEKHKDYSLRAKDHNKKKQRLKALTQKAADRNEDEFYFAMTNNATKGGVKIAKRTAEQGGGRVIEHDEVKLLKTQDAAYLRTVLGSTKKSVERLQEEVALLKKGISVGTEDSRKIIFAEDGTAHRQGKRPQREDEIDLDDLDEDLLDNSEDEEDATEPDARERLVRRKELKLAILQSRQRKLTAALLAVEDQRTRMKGGGGVTKNGKMWKNTTRKR